MFVKFAIGYMTPKLVILTAASLRALLLKIFLTIGYARFAVLAKTSSPRLNKAFFCKQPPMAA